MVNGNSGGKSERERIDMLKLTKKKNFKHDETLWPI